MESKKKSQEQIIKGYKTTLTIVTSVVITIIIASIVIMTKPDKVVAISFSPSTSPDVSGYKMYVEEFDNPVTFKSKSFDLKKRTSINLVSMLGNGKYNIGIVTVDKAGNESSMSMSKEVTINY